MRRAVMTICLPKHRPTLHPRGPAEWIAAIPTQKTDGVVWRAAIRARVREPDGTIVFQRLHELTSAHVRLDAMLYLHAGLH
jgi:hypothetical protein